MSDWNWQNIKQMLSNTLRLNFCYLNFIHILHLRYHPEIIGYILKNKQMNKCVCSHEIIGLIKTKMKMNMKNRYDIDRPRPRHGPNYSKYYKEYLSMVIIFIHNTQAIYKAQFMKKLSNSEFELKKVLF